MYIYMSIHVYMYMYMHMCMNINFQHKIKTLIVLVWVHLVHDLPFYGIHEITKLTCRIKNIYYETRPFLCE